MSASRQEQRAAASPEAQRAGEQMAHAREAAREITHERTERARVVGDVTGAAHEEGQPQPQHVDVHPGGILETVQQGARSLVSAVSRTLGVASRDTTTERLADQSMGHAAQAAAKRTEDSAAEKAKNAEDTAERFREEKLEEYKDKRSAAGVACPER